MGKVVLVTGVARHLGARFVREIRREPDVDLVVGVDVQPSPYGLEQAPPEGSGGRVADYVFARADIRRPAVARIIAEHSVDTVVHLNVTATPLGSGGRGTVKETNVIGTMQLLGACQKAPTVQRLVVKSTTSVYGSAPRDPAVFTEQMQPRALPSGGFAKDACEVEGYVRGFSRRRPDVAVCVLRFANIVGPAADTPLNEYFSLPVLPTVLGYDPRMQFVHEDDAVEVLRLAALEPRRGTTNSGTFNVAGEGVLLLSQCARRLARPTVPLLLPAISWVAGLIRQTRVADFSPEQIRLLTHGRVVDVRHLHETFGYTPVRSTAEAFADFAAAAAAGLLPTERLAAATDRLAGMLPPAGRTPAAAGRTTEGGPAGAGPAESGTWELDLR
ncbi:NAD-dependent epimerase/dehydratase family protein [Streptacidiphilus sp. ASG 303]|uniref:NAD-dependent epimerase/dehydratase family protein n=1 Tax=Streptomycetaceae TaxID=2062 RepID=UPI001E5C9F92|nr:NAD-dependent epimerase/dehydratase family protein [Streptacidiphilus sp. ASG 303]MCD0485263.1 NAD-dependent epimerase/dehydratase family protein [Streptacidiphilus sp. ASG 303]